MGEAVCYFADRMVGIPIDISLGHIKYQVQEKPNRIKTWLDEAKELLHLNETEHPSRTGKDNPSTTTVPFEAGPLIYAHLRARQNEDSAVARREYLKGLRNVKESYFAVCRDADQSFQRLYTDLLCMEPLVERLSMILTLSQMGSTPKRPQMLLDCLANLEGLICHLERAYFVDNDTELETHEEILDIKTGAPFGNLYQRLLSLRPPLSKDRALILAQADCSEETKKLAEKISDSWNNINAKRVTKGDWIDRGKAEKLYKRWLAARVSEEDTKASKKFSENTVRLETYLSASPFDVYQRVRRELFVNFYHFAHRLLMDDIVIRESTANVFEFDPLPPEALFLEQKASEATLEVMKTMVPYISLDSALQGVSRMSESIEIFSASSEIFSASSVEQSMIMLLVGNHQIISAAISRLPMMLSIAGFQCGLDNPLEYISKHPVEAAAKLGVLFATYCENCQKYDIGLECTLCPLCEKCPYHLYAQFDDETLQNVTKELAARDVPINPRGIQALVRLYKTITSILCCLVAHREADELYRMWEGHHNSRVKLLSKLEKNNFVDSILKIVQK